MFERFTERVRKVMLLANQEAQRSNHEYIGPEHLLLGLVKEGSGVGANILKSFGVDLDQVRLEAEKLVKAGPEKVAMGKLPQTPRAKTVIEYAIEEARNLDHRYVGTEHLLLGLLREHEGLAAQVLHNLGLKLDEVREAVLNFLHSSADGTPDTFGRDLAEHAGEGTRPRSGQPGKPLWRHLAELCQRKEDGIRAGDHHMATEARREIVKLVGEAGHDLLFRNVKAG